MRVNSVVNKPQNDCSYYSAKLVNETPCGETKLEDVNIDTKRINVVLHIIKEAYFYIGNKE